MSNQPPTVRYSIVDPVTKTPLPEPSAPDRLQRAVKYLTWGIVSLCLALWAVIGFIFWIPLLLRSMLHFSGALIQSMLQDARPVEAGRVLRGTVDFYRRGFVVAITAVFGDAPSPTEPVRPLNAWRFLLEVMWAAAVWYVILLAVGIIDTSPGELWTAVASYPWLERMDAIGDAIGRLF
jgi:hypothetical protein